MKTVNDLDSNENRPRKTSDLARLNSTLPTLREHQLALHRHLEKFKWEATGQTFATIYMSALKQLNSPDPCRLQCSAHCVREILEKLQESINDRIVTKPPNLRSLVTNFVQNWQNLRKHPTWKTSDWAGKPIDGVLHGFLKRLEDFVHQVRSEMPTRKIAKENLFNYLSASPKNLPPAVIDAMIGQWDDFQRYFVGMSHNQRPLDEEQYITKLDNCERFLLGILEPDSTEDLDGIDQLIAEGEHK